MRNTQQRNVIYEVVMNSYDHPTAETILERAKKIMPSINLATVYRNLNFLSENDQILKITTNKEDHFDKKVYPHIHFKCDGCGKVIDVGTNDLSTTLNIYQKLRNYEIKNIDFVITGICEECLGKIK